MLLDTILEKLQLTQTRSPNNSSMCVAGGHSGLATLDQLGKTASDRYGRFLGKVPFTGSLPPTPDHINAWIGPGNIEPLAKHARRQRLISGDDSDHGNDKSEADFALACDLFQEGFEANDVEIIMRATRYRQKFDEMRGTATYIKGTLRKAERSVALSHGHPSIAGSVLTLDHGRISIPTIPPPPRDYVWHGRMVAGHAYVLGASEACPSLKPHYNSLRQSPSACRSPK